MFRAGTCRASVRFMGTVAPSGDPSAVRASSRDQYRNRGLSAKSSSVVVPRVYSKKCGDRSTTPSTLDSASCVMAVSSPCTWCPKAPSPPREREQTGQAAFHASDARQGHPATKDALAKQRPILREPKPK